MTLSPRTDVDPSRARTAESNTTSPFIHNDRALTENRKHLQQALDVGVEVPCRRTTVRGSPRIDSSLSPRPSSPVPVAEHSPRCCRAAGPMMPRDRRRAWSKLLARAVPVSPMPAGQGSQPDRHTPPVFVGSSIVTSAYRPSWHWIGDAGATLHPGHGRKGSKVVPGGWSRSGPAADGGSSIGPWGRGSWAAEDPEELAGLWRDRDASPAGRRYRLLWCSPDRRRAPPASRFRWSGIRVSPHRQCGWFWPVTSSAPVRTIRNRKRGGLPQIVRRSGALDRPADLAGRAAGQMGAAVQPAGDVRR